MKSKISIFALSFATVCMMSSCLGDKDDTEIVTYDDASIIGLTLGELKKPSDSGKENDSVKITFVCGSAGIGRQARLRI